MCHSFFIPPCSSSLDLRPPGKTKISKIINKLQILSPISDKSQEQIKDELRQFEHSINEIDSKFVILNNNLIKYQELTNHARNALLSRDATGSKQGNATSRARMRCDFSSGLPTDRNIDDSSSMLNVEDVS